MLEPGTYMAKPTGITHGITTKKGTPYIKVLMTTEDGESSAWTGWLTPATAERTIKTLAALGFRGRSEEDLVKISLADLDNKELEIVVQEQTNQNGGIATNSKGEAYTQIAFINTPGGNAFAEATNPMEFRSKIAGLGLGALLAGNAPKPIKTNEPSFKDDSEIPF